MNFALQKTLELLLIILLGLLLQKKVAKKELNGIKTLILSIALPATIFIALLKTKLDSSLLIFPLLALVFNFIMAFATKYVLTASMSKSEVAKKRTLMMLLPSLAPGLSCFPFIVVYLGDEYLALAALADVGNKIFVLILLYVLAMHWYHLNTLKSAKVSVGKKVKGLLVSMVNEPINLVIIIALIMLGLGLNLSNFPGFIGNTITSMGVMMTPLVLLFIGMAVRVKFKELGFIFTLLLRRAGITFLLSAFFVFLFPALGASMILFLVVFPQSACSFWPFAHMSAVSSLEEKDGQSKQTFDIDFAVNVLACSLPFSTVLIISIFSFSGFFINPVWLLALGIAMVVFSFVPFFQNRFKKNLSFKELSGLSALPNLNIATKESDKDSQPLA